MDPIIYQHTAPSPFPMQTPSGVVVDERCTCGKLRSEHIDTLSYGHGPSVDGDCEKFTWSGHVIEGAVQRADESMED